MLMYNILGISVLVILTYSWPSMLFHLVATVGLVGASISWYEHNVDWWFVTLGVTFMSTTIASSFELYSNRTLQNVHHFMREKTPCCIPYIGCTNSKSVLTLTCIGRGLAGLSATVACYVSWSHRDTFWQESFPVRVAWTVTTSLWLMALLPYFICLIQCAEEKVKKDSDIDNDVDKQLYSFRKYVAMWLVHDVVLGLFWLYLSMTLHHLLKDDDSEWRTIFLSMISWHIIVFVIRELYFSNVWSTETHVSCCAPTTRSRWGDIFSLVGMAIVYVVLVHIVRDSVDMGCSTENVILICIALIVAWFGKLLSLHSPIKPTPVDQTPTGRIRNSSIKIDF